VPDRALPAPREFTHHRSLQPLSSKPQQDLSQGHSGRRSEVRHANQRRTRSWGESSATPKSRSWSSCRYGARPSQMPGMMDTSSNRHNRIDLQGLIEIGRLWRFAWDVSPICAEEVATLFSISSRPVQDRGGARPVRSDHAPQSKHENGVSRKIPTHRERFRSCQAIQLARGQAGRRGRSFPTIRWSRLWGAVASVFGSGRTIAHIVYRRDTTIRTTGARANI